jgi:hypothetical protein
MQQRYGQRQTTKIHGRCDGVFEFLAPEELDHRLNGFYGLAFYVSRRLMIGSHSLTLINRQATAAQCVQPSRADRLIGISDHLIFFGVRFVLDRWFWGIFYESFSPMHWHSSIAVTEMATGKILSHAVAQRRSMQSGHEYVVRPNRSR